jgi:hypothetical protein
MNVNDPTEAAQVVAAHPLPLSNTVFLVFIFGQPREHCRPWVRASDGSEWKARPWGEPWDWPGANDRNSAFTLADYAPDGTTWVQSTAQCSDVHGLLLDGISGQQLAQLKAALPPSYAIETQPGLHEVAYLLDDPIDVGAARALQNAAIAAGLCDPRAPCPSMRFGRLPFGINTLVLWSPDRRYAEDEVRTRLQLPDVPAYIGGLRPEEDQADWDLLRSALKAIPPDDWETRIEVGRCLKASLCEDVARTTWREWCPTFDDHDYQFSKLDPKGCTLSTLLAIAGRHGWEHPVKSATATAPPQQPAPAPAAMPQAMRLVTGETFASPEAQMKELFKGCTYVVDQHRVLVPGGKLLKPEQFKALYGGYTFAMDLRNEKTTRNAFEALTESQALRAPKVDGTCFRPDLPPGAVVTTEGRSRVNTWWPPKVDRVPGSVEPFISHMMKILPEDWQIPVYYLALLVRHPGVKAQWFPLIVGPEGNGKTVLSYCAEYAIGQRYTHWVKRSDLAGTFNAFLHGRLLLCVEDLMIAGETKMWEALKPIITGDRVSIEQKGVDQRSDEICANLIANSNHYDAVRTGADGRRVCHLWTAQETAEDIERDGMGPEEYMTRLWGWLKAGGFAHVAHWLAHADLPPSFDLAWLQGRAPSTSSSDKARDAVRTPAEVVVADALESGDLGFRGGWASSIMLRRRFEQAKAVMPGNLEPLLRQHGYVPHPALKATKGQTQTKVAMPDNGRPRLFVKQGHPAAEIPRPAAAVAAYTKAQGVAT